MRARLASRLLLALAASLTAAACNADATPEAATAELSAPTDPAACAAAAAANPFVLLTDSLNCGACGHDCLGGACSSGVCQPKVIGDGVDLVGAVYFDRAIYFIGASGLYPGRALLRFAIDDGSTVKLAQLAFPDLEPNPSWQPSEALAITGVDAAGVYVEGTRQTAPATARTELSFVPRGVGEAHVLQAGAVTELVADGAMTYFRRFGPAAAGGLRPEAVFAAPRGGGPATQIASLGSVAPVISGYVGAPSRRALRSRGGFLYAITSSSTSAYSRDEISRVPTGGGTFAKLVSVTPDSIGDILDVTGDVLVYTVRRRLPAPHGELVQTDMTTGQTDVLLDPFAGVGGVLVDAATVTFLDDLDGVSQLARDTGRLTSLAQYPTLRPSGLFGDERALYWTVGGDHGASRMMRLAR